MQETRVQSLHQEDSLEKRMVTHSSILAWRILWTEEPRGYTPWCHKESDTTEWLTLYPAQQAPFYLHYVHVMYTVQYMEIPRLTQTWWIHGNLFLLKLRFPQTWLLSHAGLDPCLYIYTVCKAEIHFFFPPKSKECFTGCILADCVLIRILKCLCPLDALSKGVWSWISVTVIL